MSDLTAAILADALDCFWNAAIGEAHNRTAAAMDVAAVTAEGLAAVSRHLKQYGLPHSITADQVAAFKHAFYTNTGDETDDPFVKAFEAIGYQIKGPA
jgi:hypothetical protein